jgi:hypothetical protein
MNRVLSEEVERLRLKIESDAAAAAKTTTKLRAAKAAVTAADARAERGECLFCFDFFLICWLQIVNAHIHTCALKSICFPNFSSFVFFSAQTQLDEQTSIRAAADADYTLTRACAHILI